MNVMLDKLAYLGPEIILGIGAVLCLFLGLAPNLRHRRLTPWVAGISLVLCIALPMAIVGHGISHAAVYSTAEGVSTSVSESWYHPGIAHTPFATFVKIAVAAVGLLLLLLAVHVPDNLSQTRRADDGSERFDPSNVIRGEFFAFFLLSLAGVMLCAGADELVWLFLALELTSLPTYIMVATSRDKAQAQESAVKYFFLGAFAVAIFLYGFALIYGATGTTALYAPEGQLSVASFVAELGDQPLPPLLIVGIALSVIGISFKIAAVPMHFYTADVYQGAATPVTAFLAFVPKTAGFVALILLLGTLGWPLPAPIFWLLWIMAALTMTLGNVLALLQHSVKRALAYSSVAHSGYMLVALTAGITAYKSGEMSALNSGLAGILFYLVAYGIGNIAAFGVLASLQRDGEEADTYDDIAGLRERSHWMAILILLSMISLVGLPPLIGFLGKIFLFAPAFMADNLALRVLVVIGVLNSAISAVYYLRIFSVCYFDKPRGEVAIVSDTPRRVATSIAGVATVVLSIFGGIIVHYALQATHNWPTGFQQFPAATASDVTEFDADSEADPAANTTPATTSRPDNQPDA